MINVTNSSRASSRASKLRAMLSLRNAAFVDGIQSLKAYNPFKAVLQTKPIKHSSCMTLIRICENLFHKHQTKVTTRKKG